MYYFTIDNVDYKCDTAEELLAIAQQAHVLTNGAPSTPKPAKRWSDRNKTTRKKAGRPKTAATSTATRGATKKKTKPRTSMKQAWAAARKRAKADGISVKEARSKIAAEKASD